MENMQQEACLHPHPEQVTDELFLTHEFFDPRNLVQVKYETLRRVQGEGQAGWATAPTSAAAFCTVREKTRAPGKVCWNTCAAMD
jgi:hypothetical protein